MQSRFFHPTCTVLRLRGLFLLGYRQVRWLKWSVRVVAGMYWLAVPTWYDRQLAHGCRREQKQSVNRSELYYPLVIWPNTPQGRVGYTKASSQRPKPYQHAWNHERGHPTLLLSQNRRLALHDFPFSAVCCASEDLGQIWASSYLRGIFWEI